MNGAVLGQTNTWHITFFASLLLWIMILGLVVMWIVDGRIKKQHAMHAFTSMLLAWVLTEIIKSIVPSIRPFHINGNTPLTLTIHNDSTFPSSHSAIAFAIALSVWLRDRRLGFCFMVTAFIVAIGRVWSNVHFVIDVIVGGMLGVSSALLMEKINLGRLLKQN